MGQSHYYIVMALPLHHAVVFLELLYMAFFFFHLILARFMGQKQCKFYIPCFSDGEQEVRVEVGGR